MRFRPFYGKRARGSSSRTLPYDRPEVRIIGGDGAYGGRDYSPYAPSPSRGYAPRPSPTYRPPVSSGGSDGGGRSFDGGGNFDDGGAGAGDVPDF